MKRAALVLTVTVLSAASAGAAAACSPRRPESVSAHIAGADVLFVGQAERSVPVVFKGHRYVDVSFRVARTLKGERRRVRVVRTSESNMCQPGYNVGQVYTVLGKIESGGAYVTPAHLMFPPSEYERAAQAARRGQ